MGCWHGTCGLTNLAIHAGEPIRLFVIRGGWAVEPSGFSYPGDGWVPVGPALKGAYDDYGGIEKVEDAWHIGAMLDELNPDIVAKKSEPGLGNAVKTPLGLDAFLEQLERDRLALRDKSKLGLFMVHEFAYRAAIAPAPGVSPWDRAVPADAMRAEGLLAIEWMGKNRKKIKERLSFMELSLFKGDIPTKSERGFNPFVQALSAAHESREQFGWMREALLAALGDPAAAEGVVADLAEFFSFRTAMVSLRRAWAPQAGKGSQDDNRAHARAMAEATIAYVDAKRRDEE
jgi:hypothetical protein